MSNSADKNVLKEAKQIAEDFVEQNITKSGPIATLYIISIVKKLLIENGRDMGEGQIAPLVKDMLNKAKAGSAATVTEEDVPATTEEKADGEDATNEEQEDGDGAEEENTSPLKTMMDTPHKRSAALNFLVDSPKVSNPKFGAVVAKGAIEYSKSKKRPADDTAGPSQTKATKIASHEKVKGKAQVPAGAEVVLVDDSDGDPNSPSVGAATRSGLRGGRGGNPAARDASATKRGRPAGNKA